MTGISRDTRNLVRLLDFHQISVVLDVGANIGQYALRLRGGGYAGTIVSFEPLPEIHAQLTAAAAADPTWLVPPPVALGDRDGTVTIHRSAESDMSSILPFQPEMAQLLDRAAYTSSLSVPLARLDTLLERHVGAEDRLFLKLDTQGYDFAVLHGAVGTLPRLLGIQIELAIEPVYQGEPPWLEAIARLDQLGFTPALFIPGYFNRRTARMLSIDGVFVRR